MHIPDALHVQSNLKEGAYTKNQVISFLGAMDDITVKYTSTGKKWDF